MSISYIDNNNTTSTAPKLIKHDIKKEKKKIKLKISYEFKNEFFILVIFVMSIQKGIEMESKEKDKSIKDLCT